MSRIVGCGKRNGPLQEKSFFIPQNDKFWCILMQFFTDKNTDITRSLGTRLYKSSLSDQWGEAVAPPPSSEYVTALLQEYLWAPMFRMCANQSDLLVNV